MLAPMIPTAAPTCPLCASADVPALWRNDKLRVIAVDDADYPGYTRVIWHGHDAEMTDLDEADQQHLMQVVLAVEAAQRAKLQPDKVNLAALGNMVPHLHWHVIPRWRRDRQFPDAIWAEARVPQGAEPESFLARRQQLAEQVGAYHSHLQQELAARFSAT